MSETALLYERILASRDEVRKGSDLERELKLGILTFILGEVDRAYSGLKPEDKEKISRNDLAAKAMQNLYKGIEQNISNYKKLQGGDSDKYTKEISELNKERDVLAGYMPQSIIPFSDEALGEVIKGYLHTAPTGQLQAKHVMVWLGKTHSGRYDGKKASTKVAELLK